MSKAKKLRAQARMLAHQSRNSKTLTKKGKLIAGKASAKRHIAASMAKAQQNNAGS